MIWYNFSFKVRDRTYARLEVGTRQKPRSTINTRGAYGDRTQWSSDRHRRNVVHVTLFFFYRKFNSDFFLPHFSDRSGTYTTTMSLIFDKKYKLDSSENFDDYMKAVGKSRRRSAPDRMFRRERDDHASTDAEHRSAP